MKTMLVKIFVERITKFDIEEAFGELWRSIPAPYKWGFLISFLVGLLAHGFSFFHIILNEDGLVLWYHSHSHYWRSGRWLVDFGRRLHEGYTFSFLNGMAAITFLSLAGCLNAALWRARSTWAIAIIAVTYVTFPVWASVFAYQFTAETGSFGALLAVVAMYVVSRGGLVHFFLGVALLALALALYQLWLALAACLCLCTLILELADDPEEAPIQRILRIAKRSFRFLLFGVISCGLYLLSVKVSVALHPGESLRSYRGIDKMGHIPLEELPSLIARTYHALFDLIGGAFFLMPSYMKASLVVMLLLSCAAALARAWKCSGSIPARAGLVLLMLGMVLLLPPCAFFTGIIAPETHITSLQTFGFLGILAITVILTVNSSRRLLKNVSIIVMCVLLLGFVNRSNAIGLKSYLFTQSAFYTANRVLMRLEEMPGFAKDSVVIFVGRLPNLHSGATNHPPFTERSEGDRKGPPGFADIDTRSATLKIANLYRMFDYRMTRGKDFLKIAEEKAAAMPMWPREGCIQDFGGMIVVNLGHSASKR